MASGWAFVDCTESGGGQAAGPTGSVQFLTGANATSGSTNLLYHTASAGGLPVSTLVLSGTLIVTGNISASSYTIKNISEIDGTGSTFFGDTADDMFLLKNERQTTIKDCTRKLGESSLILVAVTRLPTTKSMSL